MKKIESKSVVTSSNASTSAADTPVSSPLVLAIPAISVAEIQAFVSSIDSFAQTLGADFSVPQPEDMKHMTKPRKDAPTIVPMIADLSTRYGVVSAAYPTQTTLAQQQIVNTLSPVAERIAAVQKLVGAILSVGQSGAWEGSMVTYGLLKSEARGNAVLRNALVPVRDKLRPTYQTEDGGKTKLRSRSKGVTSAKAKEVPATPAPTTAAAPATAPAAPVVAAPPAATDATKSS
jgi:hypothetical protein